MNVLKTLGMLAALAVAAHLWKTQHARLADAIGDRAPPASTGLFEITLPDRMSPRGTVVFAPRDCPSEAAQRARRLGDFLGERRVAYRTADEVEFSNVQSAEQMQRTLAVMNGPVPVVFVNGRAKANPTPAEVLAELGRKS